MKPKIPKILIQPKIKPAKPKPAFNPDLKERDMLIQAKEDGCHKAAEFQKSDDTQV